MCLQNKTAEPQYLKQNKDQWVFYDSEVYKSPSRKKMAFETEMLVRYDGCRYIEKARKILFWKNQNLKRKVSKQLAIHLALCFISILCRLDPGLTFYQYRPSLISNANQSRPEDQINIAKVLLHRYYMREDCTLKNNHYMLISSVMLFIVGKTGSGKQFVRIDYIIPIVMAECRKVNQTVFIRLFSWLLGIFTLW